MYGLHELTAIGLDELTDSPTGSLPIFFRLKVWQWMNHDYPHSAHKMRISLNMIVVERIGLPLWTKHFDSATNLVPQLYLRKCAEVLFSRTSSVEVVKWLNKHMVTPEGDARSGLTSTIETEPMLAEMALWAASSACVMAAYDEHVLRHGLKSPDQVFEEDPDFWDVHYICSAIAAKGLEGDNFGNVNYRREYWTNWLCEDLTQVCENWNQIQNRIQNLYLD